MVDSSWGHCRYHDLPYHPSAVVVSVHYQRYCQMLAASSLVEDVVQRNQLSVVEEPLDVNHCLQEGEVVVLVAVVALVVVVPFSMTLLLLLLLLPDKDMIVIQYERTC